MKNKQKIGMMVRNLIVIMAVVIAHTFDKFNVALFVWAVVDKITLDYEIHYKV